MKEPAPEINDPPPEVKHDRSVDTRFKPGYVPKVRRRTGTRNKITRDLKDGIIEGAVRHGSDGKGKGGLNGYLQMCAHKHPKQYMQLLGKLLPYQITADKNIGSIGSINIVAAPSNFFLSMDQVRALNGLPSAIEVEPEPPFVIEPPAEEPEPEVAYANVRRLNPYNKDRKP